MQGGRFIQTVGPVYYRIMCHSHTSDVTPLITEDSARVDAPN